MSNRLNPYKSLYAFFLTAILAFSCVSGEKEVPDLPEMVEVDLQVGVADVSQPVLTKASDTRALPGEQIHSLVVFIVNSSGTVEKKFEPDLTTNSDAQKGELESWKSGTFTLTKGAKQVYAFANWESLGDGFTDVVATEVGATLTLPKEVSWENNSFDSTKDKFLPMSSSEPWAVSSSGTKKIELVRLVSRLKLDITNTTAHSVTITSLSMGAFNTKVNLFEGSSILETLDNGFSFDKLVNEEITLSSNSKTETPWLYVNESTAANGFTVTLETNSDHNHGGKRQTQRHDIPRNHVWNLHLLVSDYTLSMILIGENPPIGGYPEVTSSNVDGTSCILYGGGPFRFENITLKANDGATVPKDLTWSIRNTKDENRLLAEKVEVSGTTITGRMVGAAEKDQSVTFELVATSNGQEVASFQITLTFADIFSKEQP